MFLEIITPEATIFHASVESVTVPGANGEFQILNNHAPVVSSLVKGTVRFKATENLTDLHKAIVLHPTKKDVLTLDIASGTIEMNDNKVIILAD